MLIERDTLQTSLVNYRTEISAEKSKTKELEEALKTAVIGLEWWNSEHPESSSGTDDEHIHDFKQLLNKQ